nr:DUF3618 domain-containing protein [Cellulosimicrobium sp. MM]
MSGTGETPDPQLSPSQLEDEIARTRKELAGTIDELTTRLDPRVQAKAAAQQAKQAASDTGAFLSGNGLPEEDPDRSRNVKLCWAPPWSASRWWPRRSSAAARNDPLDERRRPRAGAPPDAGSAAFRRAGRFDDARGVRHAGGFGDAGTSGVQERRTRAGLGGKAGADRERASCRRPFGCAPPRRRAVGRGPGATPGQDLSVPSAGSLAAPSRARTSDSR